MLQVASAVALEVVALHVHHGLSANADAWLAHCERQCGAWRDAGLHLSFAFERLVAGPKPGASVEAWAREARYAALARMARCHGADLVLLAHHGRDQAETFLLQALRGAGPAGLAGMGRTVQRDGLHWGRPWLGASAEAVAAYVAAHGLSHVDDESNADPRFARNRLRLGVWPVLLEAFPHVDGALAAAAGWAGEARAALAELAAMDLQSVAPPDGLRVEPWRGLSAARQSNTLRAWLHREIGRVPAATLVQRLVRELSPQRQQRWPLGDGELRSYRGVVRWHAADAECSASAPPGDELARETLLRIAGPGVYALPGWRGALKATSAVAGGLPAAALEEVRLRPRIGAEQFQRAAGRPARSLKKQYQSAGVPQWDRTGPLVYSRGRLVFVPRLGVDARALAVPGEPQLALEWLEGEPPA